MTRDRRETRVLLISRLLVALTLGLAFAHVLEFFGKQQLSAGDWLMVQQHLYVAFGAIGGPIEILAIALTWTAWVLQRRDGAAFSSRWTLTAAIVITIGLIDWTLVVSPMNTVLNGWTAASIPGDWMTVRNRWEMGHAVQAALFAAGFVCLEIGATREAAPAAGGKSGSAQRVTERAATRERRHTKVIATD
jgi:hypothetical protein